MFVREARERKKREPSREFYFITTVSLKGYATLDYNNLPADDDRSNVTLLVTSGFMYVRHPRYENSHRARNRL